MFLTLELRVSFNLRGAVRKKEKLLRGTTRLIKKPRENVQIFTMFVVYINHAAGLEVKFPMYRHSVTITDGAFQA